MDLTSLHSLVRGADPADNSLDFRNLQCSSHATISISERNLGSTNNHISSVENESLVQIVLG